MTTPSIGSRLSVVAMILAGAVISACGSSSDSGGTNSPPPATPVISSFTASPSTIATGSASTLSWAVSGATSLSINQGVGTVTGSSTSVSPTATMIYTLTATNSSGSTTASATVTVSPGQPAPVASVAVTLAASTLAIGQTTTATTVLRDASSNVLTGRSITWGSASNSVATVDSNGSVTAIGIGTTAITATSEGKTGSVEVSVTNVTVASVTVTLASISIQAGQTTTAAAVAKNSGGNVLTGRSMSWSSSSPSVASVSTDGTVTALTAGTALIIATSGGASGAATITVTATLPAAVASVTVALEAGSILVGGTTQATPTMRDASGSVLTGRSVTWTSSNTGVAAVSPTGLVAGVEWGSATITATSEGRSGSVRWYR